jgi:uncharacterized membrane protein YgdD (TMEM256/DUF423 family)
MGARWWFAIGAVIAGLAIAAGAYGAHGLKPKVEQHQIDQVRLDDFDTGLRHHFYHALGLTLVAVVLAKGRPVGVGKWLAILAGLQFLAGIVFFCGGLYAFAITGETFWFKAAPLGGTLFILAWFELAVAGWLAFGERRPT